MAPPKPGTLWVCACPIGNFGDVSLRLKETLESVDAVFCEDTRVTGLLLKHLGIKKPLQSCHKFSEKRVSETAVQRLLSGQSMAYLSDAGTPGISDPGSVLVRTARSNGIPVKAIPGPSAITTLLSISGYDGPFAFVGFLPRKAKQLIDLVTPLLTLDMAVVFYESPHRIQKSTAILNTHFAQHPLFLARELTKSYEEFFCGTAVYVDQQLQRKPSWKGEFSGIIAPKTEP